MSKSRISSNMIYSLANELGMYCTSVKVGVVTMYTFRVGNEDVGGGRGSREAMAWLSGYQYAQSGYGEPTQFADPEEVIRDHTP